MHSQPQECPKCKATGKFFVKKGYYRNKYDHQRVPRYKCKECGKWFSSHTILPTYKQKKPFLNHLIYNLYASAMTQRRLARVLHCNLKTIARKFRFIAKHARKYHEDYLNNRGIITDQVEFDEMETFEHTRLQPLSIAIAVDANFVKLNGNRRKSNKIISFKVASMQCHGHMSTIARQKYGRRPDRRNQACLDVLSDVAKCQMRYLPFTITTDAKKAYPSLIKQVMPNAVHSAQSRHAAAALGTKPMFALNLTAAKIRHDLSRMVRKTWVTTKEVWGLEDHLMLYVAWNNKYPIFQQKNGMV